MLLKAALLMGFALLPGARSAEEFVAIGKSTFTNGVAMLVTGHENRFSLVQKYVPKPTERLVIQFLTQGERDQMIRIPGKAEYRALFTLWDDHEKLIPRTSLGQEYGRKFHELREPSQARPLASAYAVPAFHPENGLSPGIVFPTPAELFQIPGPGVYHLQIECQVFLEQTDATLKLVKLLPARLDILAPKSEN